MDLLVDNLEIMIEENQLKKATDELVKADVYSDKESAECMNTSETTSDNETVEGKETWARHAFPWSILMLAESSVYFSHTHIRVESCSKRIISACSRN